MPDKLSDRAVLLAILLTLMLVFGLIFSTRPPNIEKRSPLQWRDPSPTELRQQDQSGTLQI